MRGTSMKALIEEARGMVGGEASTEVREAKGTVYKDKKGREITKSSGGRGEIPMFVGEAMKAILGRQMPYHELRKGDDEDVQYMLKRVADVVNNMATGRYSKDAIERTIGIGKYA